ncbi:hypothetical protein D9757_012584 [Collybiopsis confluens]|uniref:DUF218 domain-containing protein n=1 Tax=Collybiopsis confluens TaxID=2823264 RepID=A0A8H5FVY8_9AGAR|nr:hypothetical protein D9757_012584 [Collybiopsis confluens]
MKKLSIVEAGFKALDAQDELLNMWRCYVGAINRIMKYIDQIRATRLNCDWGNEYILPLDAIYLAVRLMDANNQVDALRYPELWTKDNVGPAVSVAGRIDWNARPYAAILIPGEGPELAGVRLSPMVVLKMEMAVKQYKEGKAPFLIVSGGTFHPALTEFNEAYKMKSWLVEQHGISPDRVILEPYARHTTTNFRNAGRVLNTIGAPREKPVLTVTDGQQIEYIESDLFRRNEREELTHGVGKIGPRRGDFAIDFVPLPLCAIVDPMDPMDP